MRTERTLGPDTEIMETVCENEKDSGHLMGGNGFRLSTENLLKYPRVYEFAPGRQATLTVADGHLVFQDGASGHGRRGCRSKGGPQKPVVLKTGGNSGQCSGDPSHIGHLRNHYPKLRSDDKFLAGSHTTEERALALGNDGGERFRSWTKKAGRPPEPTRFCHDNLNVCKQSSGMHKGCGIRYVNVFAQPAVPGVDEVSL